MIIRDRHFVTVQVLELVESASAAYPGDCGGVITGRSLSSSAALISGGLVPRSVPQAWRRVANDGQDGSTGEPALVETLVPEPAIEGFRERVLNRLSRLNELQCDTARVRPLIECFAGELRPVIADDHPRRHGSRVIIAAEAVTQPFVATSLEDLSQLVPGAFLVTITKTAIVATQAQCSIRDDG